MSSAPEPINFRPEDTVWVADGEDVRRVHNKGFVDTDGVKKATVPDGHRNLPVIASGEVSRNEAEKILAQRNSTHGDIGDALKN